MKNIGNKQEKLKIYWVDIDDLRPSEYNPRKWMEKEINDLKESIKRFGIVEPLVVNSAKNRKNIVIGGHFRLKILKELGFKKVPVVYVNISDIQKEKELNLRLNKNLGEWDWSLLCEFDKDLLLDVGFERWQLGLFNEDEFQDLFPPMEEGKPEELAYKVLKIYFDSKKSFEEFKELVKKKLKITDKTDSLWFKKRVEKK
jgi:site-specific DNA-methyltransferase (adenine-specific)